MDSLLQETIYELNNHKKEKSEKDKQEIITQQRFLLHYLNDYITHDKLYFKKIKSLINGVNNLEEIILEFLIYLMKDKHQCNFRHGQNKLIAYAFQNYLDDEDFSWKKARNKIIGPWSQFDVTTMAQQQAMKAAANAYCAWAFVSQHHLKEASYQSMFEHDSEVRQSNELLKILEEGV